MTSKSNKYVLLDKNEENESEMIEMVDWSTIQNNKNSKKNGEQSTDYVRLDEQSTNLFT